MRNKLLIIVFMFSLCPYVGAEEITVVGSKNFTENVILGEIAFLLAKNQHLRVEHKREFGTSSILYGGLIRGDIDLYPEYSSTLTKEILLKHNLNSLEELRGFLETQGLRMTHPLGFNNTYSIGVKRSKAEALGLEKISDIRRHPELRFGITHEFLDRKDGWESFSQAYGLDDFEVVTLDHDLAYSALDTGDIDLKEIYTTDAEIKLFDLKVLEDDHKYFPEYFAIYVYHSRLESRAPEFIELLNSLAGRISEEQMVKMNAAAKIDGFGERAIAAEFLETEMGISAYAYVSARTLRMRLWQATKEHFFLVFTSMFFALIISFPLGILASKTHKIGSSILGTVGIIQTIPSLALLVVTLPWLGIGAAPAIFALTLYSLLPIVRNIAVGMKSISPSLLESGIALGLNPRALLFKIELPLAMPTILAGIKTALVINIGTAVLGALIGAGGYGSAILMGIRRMDSLLLLEGALPAAAFAIFAQVLFDQFERFIVSPGLLSDRGKDIKSP